MSRSRKGRDPYGRRAKSEGFPARSVYKLEEIDRRLRLLRAGDRVLDLGASPGSWTMYAAGKVGRSGHVLGIDLNPHRGALPPNAEIRVGDVTALDPATLGGPASYDVVMSDMAPRTTGQRSTDQYRSFELFMRALEVAGRMLRPGGHFVGKIFQGAEFEEARGAVARRFRTARIVRPKATRDVSYELFIAGLGFRGETASEP